MRFKNVPVRIKAGPEDGLEEGQFEAYASVFGNVDAYGDVVMPGAFANTLAEWAGSGNALPVLYGHVMSDPDYNIGHVIEAREDDHGLRVRGQLDLESPKGAQTHRLLKGRRVSQLSFAYDVIRGGMGQVDGQDAYELRELKVYEVSLVLVGANQDTEVLAVKGLAEALAGGVKEGRVLSAKHMDSLRSARDAIDAVLVAAEGGSDQEKASGTGSTVNDEGAADRVKSEEPAVPGSSVQILAWEALAADLEVYT